ncbi:hypothetical protein [Paraburkholderia diazotrophica]|uniref:hypothetical protein n=1 Tax=Paraburkholderia diazotrophica TaxID=667676 RepID=UPI00115FDFEE|nr:hypothetical protein [Paraburkholderia diazotrophica]
MTAESGFDGALALTPAVDVSESPPGADEVVDVEGADAVDGVGAAMAGVLSVPVTVETTTVTAPVTADSGLPRAALPALPVKLPAALVTAPAIAIRASPMC